MDPVRHRVALGDFVKGIKGRLFGRVDSKPIRRLPLSRDRARL
jgi:hypothetical protein